MLPVQLTTFEQRYDLLIQQGFQANASPQRPEDQPKKRSLALFVFSVVKILIGISRISLGEHWASDVLGAYTLGSLTLVAIIQFYIWGKTRFFGHQPVAAATTTPELPKKGLPTTAHGAMAKLSGKRRVTHAEEK